MQAANANLSADFQRCHPKTAAWEGGWSNHRQDPGGKTMYGVTEAVFWEWLDSRGQPRRPVRSITQAEALQIYYTNYWLKAGCESLVPGVDLAVYDASVNSGVSRGRKWLMASLNPANDHVKTVKGICAKRLGFVQSLKIWQTFGKGWLNRITDIEATGVAWALAAMSANDNGQVMTGLRDEQAAAQKKAANQTKGAGASSAAGGASGTGLALDPGSADQVAGWLLGGLLVAGLGIAAFLVIRAVINRQRAAAYGRVSEAAAISGAV